MVEENTQQYIYIVKASNETNTCKIGKTNDLDRRLKDYNNITGISKNTTFQYLFSCEVKDMVQVESDIKEEFRRLREQKNREIYFFNDDLFDDYVNFIKEHPLFVKDIFIKKKDDKVEKVVKIVKRTKPTLEEQGLTSKNVMQKAKRVNDDEFYTQYKDVEKELAMYDKSIWKDKVVFCNCDDAVDDDDRRTSAFALYFMRNFKELKLKKLICTHYGGGTDIFYQGKKGYVFTYIFTKDGFEGIKEYPLNYTGSFDDPFSLKILNEEADIVCTNPPFSRGIDYWRIVIESGKKFLFIGNFANIQTTAYIHYFKDNKIWTGYNRVLWFLTPKKELTDAPGIWYTNFPINNRPRYKNLKIMPLKKIPEKYKRYDDSKTLLVDNCYIPSDYKKPFAVSAFSILNGVLEKGYKIVQEKRHNIYINGKEKYARVLVQKV
jgi:predicted GIY-YIG superfamily endonuclease